jgi:hypothetical protein
MMTDSQTLVAEYVRSGSEPAFRELVARYVNLPPLLFGLGIVATAYCVRVWIRKADAGHSWVAFLAPDNRGDLLAARWSTQQPDTPVTLARS